MEMQSVFQIAKNNMVLSMLFLVLKSNIANKQRLHNRHAELKQGSNVA